VVILGDGYLGQVTGTVRLPETMVKPGLPAWAVWGDRAHRNNLVCSIYLSEADLEAHNNHAEREVRGDDGGASSADLYRDRRRRGPPRGLQHPGRMAKGAVRELRSQGIKAGLFRPITCGRSRSTRLRPLLDRVRRIVVVEASNGQLEDELRLAISHAEWRDRRVIEHVRRFGGILPQQNEIVDRVLGGGKSESQAVMS
jgi:2-oxoisovalerate ferredoxin oxidoreductase alpha subunit